ncbi:hypothetical protein HAX54_048322, partial [Datura stramonium]|nr:hypothetical protein [Datura stramonium]
MGRVVVLLKCVWVCKWEPWKCLVQFGDDDIQRFAGGVQRNAYGMLVQVIVGFRPLSGSRVASAVHGSVLVTRRLVFGSPWVYSVFCLTSTSHRRIADSSCNSS